MRIQMLGAAGGHVTGSGMLLESDKARVLVDFGQFQGSADLVSLNRLPEDLDAADLDAVVLSHAHLDHCGRLPLLAKAGYRGPVFATAPTLELAGLVMRDAAKIQLDEIKRAARSLTTKAKKTAPPLPQPLFTGKDVERIVGQGQAIRYGQKKVVAPGVTLRLTEAGHLLGSASVELTVEDAGAKKTVVVSGDLGQRGAPLLRDPEPFASAHAVFMECTYGGRIHRPLAETLDETREILVRVLGAGGRVIVPSFALGRAQMILYLLAEAFKAGVIPKVPVFLDSPMAIEATNITSRYTELFDEESQAFVRSGDFRRGIPTLQATATGTDSKKINKVAGPCLILAGSGMCTAGRILHHLSQGLPNPRNAVLIVGYQAEGTLGRSLVEGASSVEIFGETIKVAAEVHTLGGFSAHADHDDLMQWMSVLAPSRPLVFLTHGEDASRSAVAEDVAKRFGLETRIPALGESFTL